MTPENLFELNIMPHTDKLYRYALSILKEPDTAHDVVQDCLVKIWKGKEKLTQIHNHEAWAMRIVRNQCFDWVKTNRFSVLNHDDANRKPDTDTADLATLIHDQQKWLTLILNDLPEKQQEIYHLREVEELPYQDIAEVLDLGLSEVKVYLHRARTKIRMTIEKLENYGIAN